MVGARGKHAVGREAAIESRYDNCQHRFDGRTDLGAGGVAGFVSYSNPQYTVSFLMRADGLPVSSAAALLGLATGGIDIFVMLVTGPLINGGATASPDQDMAADVGANLIGPRFCDGVHGGIHPDRERPTARDLTGQHFPMPALYILAQNVSPLSMRATAAALMIGVISLAGYGLGSPVIGLISDVGQVVMASHGVRVRIALSLSLGSSCLLHCCGFPSHATYMNSRAL